MTEPGERKLPHHIMETEMNTKTTYSTFVITIALFAFWPLALYMVYANSQVKDEPTDAMIQSRAKALAWQQKVNRR